MIKFAPIQKNYNSYNKAKNSLGSNAFSTLKGMELLTSILWLNIFTETMEEAAYENLSMWRGTSGSR